MEVLVLLIERMKERFKPHIAVGEQISSQLLSLVVAMMVMLHVHH